MLQTMNKSTKRPLTYGLKTYQIAALAVYELGGAKKYVDTEDAAVKAFSLAPKAFAWQKYPQFPNLELVRVALSDAKKRKNGTLLSGSGREGWRLTSAGLNWAATTIDETGAVGFAPDAKRRSAGSIDTVRKNRELARLHQSEAWKLWFDRKPITPNAANELFRIDDYSSRKLIEGKIMRMQAMFHDVLEIRTFLTDAGDLILRAGAKP